MRVIIFNLEIENHVSRKKSLCFVVFHFLKSIYSTKGILLGRTGHGILLSMAVASVF